MTTIQSSPSYHKLSLTDHLRLVWALASKDIVDALKTRTTLTVIVLSVFMVFFYRYLPIITSESDSLTVLLYSESESALSTALETSPELAVYQYDSREGLMESFYDAEDLELAIVIPETAVAQAERGDPITVEGHLMYWVSDQERADIKARVEADLSGQLGQPVTLNLEGNDVNFDANRFFFAFSATIALLFISLMIGISLIPNLMIEEKQTRTIDALMVSPASESHLVAGKALAGLFYGLLGSVVVLFVFHYLILQWELAILAAVLGTLFMVGVGLFLGSVLKVQAQLQLMGFFLAIPLLLPVLLVALVGLVPDNIIAVLNWFPTVLVATLFRMSMTPNAVFANFGTETAVLVGANLAMLALVVWVIRRRDRG